MACDILSHMKNITTGKEIIAATVKKVCVQALGNEERWR